MCTIPDGVGVNNFFQVFQTKGVIRLEEWRVGSMLMCLCLVSVDLTIVLSYPWDSCFDLPPVEFYTQSTQICYRADLIKYIYLL